MKNFFRDSIFISLGSIVMALGYALFLVPADIVPGGLTGVGMIIAHFFPVPVGMTVLVLNVPLFALSWRKLGLPFILRTLVGTVASSVFIDVFSFIPAPECNLLAAAVFGGIISGAGYGLVFAYGGTTGGTDMVVKLIKLKFPSSQLGALVMVVDGLVVAGAMFAFRSVDLAFYAVASIFAAVKVMDAMLYGVNAHWSVTVMTDRVDEINAEIHEKLDRGTTLLLAEGGYKNAPKKVILTAVRRQQLGHIKELVKAIDPDAFIIVNSAYDVLGEGFRAYDHNQI